MAKHWTAEDKAYARFNAKKVSYEFALEELDSSQVADGAADPDIVDTNHYDTAAEMMGQFMGAGTQVLRPCVIRDVISESEGVEDRQYAYPVDGKLPVAFDGRATVPQYIRAAWDTALAAAVA